MSRWRKDVLKKDRDRKRREKRRKKERPHGVVVRGNSKGAAISGMMKSAKPNRQTMGKDAMRNYVTQHPPGSQLAFNHRLMLAADRNRLIRAGRPVTFRQFAARHGLGPETWRRECHRGAMGCTIPDRRDRRRRKHAEHDPFKAQNEIGRNNANKGTKMLVTNRMAFLFRKHAVGCDVYYTRARASREKGSVENCNRFVGRWHAKGTDFGRCTRADMHRLEDAINST